MPIEYQFLWDVLLPDKHLPPYLEGFLQLDLACHQFIAKFAHGDIDRMPWFA
jgi:hypothetical protein